MKKVFKEFKQFILRGNLVDLAVGFTVGASFSTVAKSLVSDLIMPPLALILGKSDFSNLFIVLKEGTKSPPYETLAEAQNAGAVTWNWGAFMTNFMSLLVVALAMFLVIRLFNKLESGISTFTGKSDKGKDKEPSSKKCPFCYSNIAYRAVRCPECTSHLEKPKKELE